MVDEHGGKGDLERKVIAAVGKADERFQEDALRTLRAVRLSAELDFVIDGNTAAAIAKDAAQLAKNI
jgi:tRNA nucleotidyltransferase (CCA-adding enzyme)